MLQKLENDEDETSYSAADVSFGPVFVSSTTIFAFIKSSIQRCTSLTNGETFLKLTVEFKRAIAQYAEFLRLKLPIASGIQNPVYKLAPGVEVTTIAYL